MGGNSCLTSWVGIEGIMPQVATSLVCYETSLTGRIEFFLTEMAGDPAAPIHSSWVHFFVQGRHCFHQSLLQVL